MSGCGGWRTTAAPPWFTPTQSPSPPSMIQRYMWQGLQIVPLINSQLPGYDGGHSRRVGNEGVHCGPRIRVCQSGEERNHFQTFYWNSSSYFRLRWSEWILNINIECRWKKGFIITHLVQDATKFAESVVKIREDKSASVFSERTEDSSASQYFQFYGYLSQQQNMMQDFIRTSTYQKAILDNPADFSGKVLLIYTIISCFNLQILYIRWSLMLALAPVSCHSLPSSLGPSG